MGASLGGRLLYDTCTRIVLALELSLIPSLNREWFSMGSRDTWLAVLCEIRSTRRHCQKAHNRRQCKEIRNELRDNL